MPKRKGAKAETSLLHAVADQWRDLAERVRREAIYAPADERRRLLDLADIYEARAAGIEAQDGKARD